MWLVVSLVAAFAASAAYFFMPAKRKGLRLGLLSLMLWGTAIMVAVDHSISYLEGGPFIEASTDGLIGNSILLGIAMLVPVFAIWAFAAFTPVGKNIAA
ncbi:MAG: hypothetical protein WCT52_00515 [Candidatus Micrarchaeia archaeon]